MYTRIHAGKILKCIFVHAGNKLKCIYLSTLVRYLNVFIQFSLPIPTQRIIMQNSVAKS